MKHSMNGMRIMWDAIVSSQPTHWKHFLQNYFSVARSHCLFLMWTEISYWKPFTKPYHSFSMFLSSKCVLCTAAFCIRHNQYTCIVHTSNVLDVSNASSPVITHVHIQLHNIHASNGLTYVSTQVNPSSRFFFTWKSRKWFLLKLIHYTSDFIQYIYTPPI